MSDSLMEREVLYKGDLVVKHGSAKFLGRFKCHKRLGAGSFGAVTLLRDKASGQDRVCKTVSTQGLKPGVLDLMKKEIMILQELDHPRIVKLFEFAEDTQEQKLYLLLEHLAGGDCEELIKDKNRPSEGLLARVLSQVLSATAYCHMRGIVHSDMKPENIMLTVRPGCARLWCSDGFWCNGESVDAKVIDFGLAAHFSQASPDSIQVASGTPAFMAPEVVRTMQGGATYGPKADIWSIGVTAYRLLTSEYPFGHHYSDFGGDIKKVFANIEKFDGHIDFDADRWDDRSESAGDFVSHLMCVSPEHRPSAQEALQLGWLQLSAAIFHKRLTRSVLRSLRDYAEAKRITKMCMFLIASRATSRNLWKCRRAFMQLDAAGTGALTLEDLENAIEHPGGCCSWLCYPTVDAEQLFEAMDLSQSGVIEYTEFAAACLYSKFRSRSGRDLAYVAFHAIDDNQDGFVTASDILKWLPVQDEELAGQRRLVDLPPGQRLDKRGFYRYLKLREPPGQWMRTCTCTSVASDSESDDASSESSHESDDGS